MRHRIKRERFDLGMWGTALLRGWPLGDAGEADRQIESLRGLLEQADEGRSETFEFEDPGLDAAYAAWSETYDALPNALIDAEEPFVREMLRAVRPGEAVDAACGTGRLTSVLIELGHRVIGIDPSPEMLAVARRKELSATFVEGDLDALPAGSESADLVVCALALTHVEDLRRPVGELARVLRPGGTLILSDFHPIPISLGGQALFESKEGSRGLARSYVHWPSDYAAAFGESGLRIEELAEPLVDDAFLEQVTPGDTIDAARAAFLGLPLAILWRCSKP